MQIKINFCELTIFLKFKCFKMINTFIKILAILVIEKL